MIGCSSTKLFNLEKVNSVIIVMSIKLSNTLRLVYNSTMHFCNTMAMIFISLSSYNSDRLFGHFRASHLHPLKISSTNGLHEAHTPTTSLSAVILPCLFVCLAVCLCMCLSVCLCVCLCLLLMCLSVCLSACQLCLQDNNF